MEKPPIELGHLLIYMGLIIGMTMGTIVQWHPETAHMDSTCRLRGDLFVTLLAKRDGSFKQSDYSRAKGAVGSF